MLRKKRVTMTEQAQAAIAAGMPVDQALAEHGAPVPAAETPATPEGQAPVVGDPPSTETPAVVEPEGGAPAPVTDPAAERG